MLITSKFHNQNEFMSQKMQKSTILALNLIKFICNLIRIEIITEVMDSNIKGIIK